MNIKLREVVQAEAALGRLFECNPKKAKDTYRVARLKRELTPILKDYEEARQQLLEQYAVKSEDDPNRWQFVKVDEDGDIILEYDEGDKDRENGKPVMDMEAFNAFTTDLDELIDSEEVQVESFITLAQIDNLGFDPAMTPNEMAMLWWLVKELREDTEIKDED